MAFCPNCGNNVTGSFCSNCGTNIGPAQAAGPGQGQAPPPAPVAGAGMDENVASALCYALGLVTGIVFLALAPFNQNPRVKFNAWQSILFNVAWILLWIVLHIVSSVLVAATGLFGLLMIPVYGLVSLTGLILWLFLMWKAYQGSPFELPVIAGIARQQAGK